jgi:hypothetical protein
MKTVLGALSGLVLGILNGFDRLVLRGHLRRLSYPHGMEPFLRSNGVLFKDFKEHSKAQTARLLQASFAEAKRLQRPIVYLESASESKEDRARAIANQHGIREGLIAIFKCVEPCSTFFCHFNRNSRSFEILPKIGQCSFLYRYAYHPLFGFMNARVQTWYPFAVQICLNGREWLARQLDQAGLKYRRRDNKFVWVEDFARAQQFLDQQLQVNWPTLLNAILQEVHPAHPDILGRMPMDYYWSVYQNEWATDILFRAPADLKRLYPQWLRYAMTNFHSTDVLRFLGRKLTPDGQIWNRFDGQITGNMTRRAEGVRIKHWVDSNSMKAYDFIDEGIDQPYAGLRIEQTMHDPSDFRVYRPKQGGPEDDLDWRPLRKSVADLHRRAEVGQAANERYATALFALQDKTPVSAIAEPLCRRAPAPGKPTPGTRQRNVRALNPLAAEDAALLTAVLDPKFTLNGLRNRDLVTLLYDKPTTDDRERRRRSARVTRLIRLLRGHGLLHKVPKTHRYMVSDSARKTVTAILAARNANTDALIANAA